MATLPPMFLKSRRWRQLKLLDIVTLLRNLYDGNADPEVGFEDASETIQSITKQLNKKVWIEPRVLESALWSANLLNEKGKFTDVKGRSFEEFVREMLQGVPFHKFYNTIEDERHD